jgi:hypothetical protein
MSGGSRHIVVDFETGVLKIEGGKVLCNLKITAPCNIKYYLTNTYSELNTSEYQKALQCIGLYYQNMASNLLKPKSTLDC